MNSPYIDLLAGFFAGYMSYRYLPYEAVNNFIVTKIFEISRDVLHDKKILKKTKYDEIILCFIFTMISIYCY